jgi:DNA-binding beta-propeller fold protein YncE
MKPILLLGALTIGLLGCGDSAPVAAADCPTGAVFPVAASHLPGPPASEDFTFDGEGYLVGLLGGHSLVRSARGRPPALLVPNVVATGRGLRMLPGGDFVVADRDRSLVVRVSTSGDTRRLTTEITSPNGIALAPSGELLVTNFGGGGEIYRVSPDSGDTAVLSRPGEGSNGVALSPDGRWLYVGNHDTGTIQRLALGSDGSAGPPETFASGLVRPDGLATDACGNLYAASWDRKLYRVDPDGKVEVMAELDGPGSAVQLGSGRQGWDAGKLYVMAVDKGGVYEVDPAPAAR